MPPLPQPPLQPDQRVWVLIPAATLEAAGVESQTPECCGRFYELYAVVTINIFAVRLVITHVQNIALYYSKTCLWN